MSDYYFEVSLRNQNSKWVVLAVSPRGNTEATKDSLVEALHEASKVFEREKLRYASCGYGHIDR